MKAERVYYDEVRDEELIEVGDHKIQFGGNSGDGYCYNHQDFICLDQLTDEEYEALKRV